MGLPIPIVDADDELLLGELRRDTARSAEGSAPQASEVHSLLMNTRTTMHLEALHRTRPFDLVYERQSLWSLAGLAFARRHDLPFFLEVNAPLVAQQAEYRELVNVATAEAISDLLLAHADRIVVPSRALATHLVERGARAGRVRVVPCGVSRSLFVARRLPRPSHGPGDPFTVGFVGSLKPWHGVETLLDAFVELRRCSAAYRLLVVGDGPLRALVEDRCAREHPAGVVMLVGSVPYEHVPDCLARMDVGLAPYPELPLFYFSPLKVLEYAAAGVPIVASASGQIAELFVHREHALLHPPGRVRKIVKHVELLRVNPDLGVRLARRARRVVARTHTWDRLAARVLGMAASTRRTLGSEPGRHP